MQDETEEARHRDRCPSSLTLAVKRLGRALERTLNLAGAIVTIGLALGISAILDAFWPVGVVVAEGLAILILVALLVRKRRAVKRLPADQARLDELLALLTRSAIRRVAEHDFAIAWPARIMFPVTTLLEEFGSIEHQFQDARLEERRAHLFACADTFSHAEAANGWTHPSARTERYVGVTGFEAEGDVEKAALLDDRSLRIRRAAWAFTDAHDALLATAIERGYDVSAVKGDHPLHPRSPGWRHGTRSGGRDLDCIENHGYVPPHGDATARRSSREKTQVDPEQRMSVDPSVTPTKCS